VVVNRELLLRQVAAVAEVVDVAIDLAVEVWLRGGWAMDFYLGGITRDHLDVDWFVWAGAMPGLVGELLRRGWTDRSAAAVPAGGTRRDDARARGTR